MTTAVEMPFRYISTAAGLGKILFDIDFPLRKNIYDIDKRFNPSSFAFVGSFTIKQFAHFCK